MDMQSRREALHALRLLQPTLDAAGAASQLATMPSAQLDRSASQSATAAVAREQAKQSLQLQAHKPQQFAAAFDALRARAPAVLDEMVEVASLAFLRGPAILGGASASSANWSKASVPAVTTSTTDILATLASASSVLQRTDRLVPQSSVQSNPAPTLSSFASAPAASTATSSTATVATSNTATAAALLGPQALRALDTPVPLPPQHIPRADSATDLVDVFFGSKIVLESTPGRFVSVSEPASLCANASRAETFHVINADHKSDKSAIRYMDTIMLRARNGRFVCCDESGRVFVSALASSASDITSPGGQLPSEQRARWRIQAIGAETSAACSQLHDSAAAAAVASSTGWPPLSAVGNVKAFDRLVLRACDDRLFAMSTSAPDSSAPGHSALSVQTAIAGGGAVDPAAHVWRICLAAAPFASDWSRARDSFAASSGPSQVDSELFPSTAAFSLRGQPARSPTAVTAAAERLSNAPGVELSSLPVEIQDALLAEEMLFALIGVEGRFIVHNTADSDSVFELRPALRCDEACAHLVQLLLPLPTHYAFVNRFVTVHSRPEHGLVLHALCAALRTLLKEYLILVAQLESQARGGVASSQGALTLQRLFFYCQPALHTLSRLHRLTSRIRTANVHGGALLNLIHGCLRTEGDEAGAALYEQLLRAAAAPYLAMLEHWLYRGRVADPYDEFCIAERTDVQRASNRQEQAGGLLSDSYWESRYTLRERHVWAPLARCADQLLVAGKYLNVVRDARTDQRLRLRREARTQANASQTAGGPLVGTATAMADEDLLFPHAQPLVFGTSEQVFSERVDAAHRYASRTLLDLLLGERQLLARLRSIKSLFFLERGDFFQQFCDAAFDELQKPVRDISAAKLDALLDMTLRSSTAADDEFGDDLSCHLQQYSLLQKLDALYKADPKRQNEPAAVDTSTTRLKGIDALTFDFKVRWPESLVLSRATLTKYQLVFRHLLRLKQVERTLQDSWVALQATRELSTRVGAAFAPYFILRHRMLLLVQGVAHHCTVEVLEPAFTALEEKIRRSASTVDEVIFEHDRFLDACMRGAMLTNAPLYRCLSKLLATCELFAENVARVLTSAPLSADDFPDAQGSTAYRKRQARIQVASESLHRLISAKDNNYAVMLKQFSEQFDKRVLELMTLLLQQSFESHADHLFARLDFNGFYAARLREQGRASQSVSAPPAR